MQTISRIRNPFVLQYLLELLLPIVGYYLFDWGILIIGLFYLIDYLAAIVAFIRRGFLVNKHSRNKVSLFFKWMMIFLLFVFFLILLFTFSWYAMHLLDISMATLLSEAKIAFISELWMIIPLVFVMTIYNDRFTFIMPRRYLNYDPKRYFLAHLFTHCIIVLLFFLFAYSTLRINCPEAALIPIFLFGKIGFDLTVQKWAKKWSLYS